MFAFCSALESMAFWEGCLARSRLLGEEALSVLLLRPCDLLLEWPRWKPEAFSLCGMAGSQLKAEVDKVGSGGDVDKYEVSLNVVDSSPPGRYVVRSALGSCAAAAAAARPKSS